MKKLKKEVARRSCFSRKTTFIWKVFKAVIVRYFMKELIKERMKKRGEKVEEVRKKRDEESLEKKLENLILMIIPVFVLYIVDNITLTGFATLSGKINVAIGSVLWVSLFLVVFALLYFKVRAINKNRKSK